jgi:hypothetical protein
MLLVVQSIFRTGGLDARNGVKSSQAASQTLTAWGYFRPQGDSAKASRASRASKAASAVGAV